jgi:hypothetical protein
MARHHDERLARLVLYSGTAEVEPPSLREIFAQKGVENLGEIKEISARSRFKVQAMLTREYGKKISQGAKYDMLTFKILYGGKAHAVNLFNSGKITFTGGYPDGATSISDTPKEVLRIALGHVENFELRNVTVQYEGHFKGSLDSIRRALGAKESKSQFATVPGANIRVYGSGVVQVSGITRQSQVAVAAEQVRKLVQLLKSKGVVRDENRVVREPASKIVSTTCPKDRRPVPYSFGGQAPSGYYIAPNPQGQPCCYKIPIKTAYLREKIVDRFKALGLGIPKVTRNAFGIPETNGPVNAAPKVNRNMVFTRAANGTLKIGSRQAKRYSMNRLLNISRRLGVALDVKGKTTQTFENRYVRGKLTSKEKLIEAIGAWANKQQKVVQPGQAVLTKITNVRNANQGILRLGPRGRAASSYTKPQLVLIGRKLRPPISLVGSKQEMLDDLRKHIHEHGHVFSAENWPTTSNLDRA